MDDGRPWPRVSIVTPSYNQGRYLEATIRSVLLQGYPDVELAVVDGGSTDESPEILRKYRPWLAFGVSERDSGQSAAINKGLARMTGEVFNWINSDDWLVAGGLRVVAEAYRRHPRSLIAGDVLYAYGDLPPVERQSQHGIELRALVEFWNHSPSYHQPGLFIPMHLMKIVGQLDDTLHYVFDHEILCRLLRGATVEYLPEPVAVYRVHPATKSSSKGSLFFAELCASSRRHWDAVPNLIPPEGDRKGAGLLLRAGLWLSAHGHGLGGMLIKDALRTDPWGAVISSVRYFPGWIARRFDRGVR